MKTCDRCNAIVDELFVLLPQYDNLEMCNTCRNELEDILVAIHSQGIQHIKARQQIAFREWLGKGNKEDGVPELPAQRTLWDRLKLFGGNRNA